MSHEERANTYFVRRQYVSRLGHAEAMIGEKLTLGDALRVAELGALRPATVKVRVFQWVGEGARHQLVKTFLPSERGTWNVKR